MRACESVALQQSTASAPPKRKRRFKIFQTRSKPEPDCEQQHTEQIQQICLQTFSKKKPVYEASTKLELIKIPQKLYSQQQFEQEQDYCQLVLLQPGIDGLKTVGSQKFGVTGELFDSVTSPVMFRGNQFVINQASILYQSVSQLKSSFHGFGSETVGLADSVAQLGETVGVMVSEGLDGSERLRALEQFLEQVRVEKSGYQQRISKLDQRIQNLQFRQSVCLNDLCQSQEGQELKVFIQDKGYRVELEDDDEMAESQFLPAAFIAEFMEERRARAEQKLRKSRKQQVQKLVGKFHPVLGITQAIHETLMGYIAEQFPAKKVEEVSLTLLFRRSTVDLDSEWLGEKQSLEYKQCLLFVIRNSLGRCFGGFISNDLIEEQLRQDPHAFLFSLHQGCNKFRVKQQFQEGAYQASKHYLICFSSDLMISTECIEEESYCQWPSSYAGRNDSSTMMDFAGDFSFMIEHIEVYEVCFL